jgi:hypothetical protein
MPNTSSESIDKGSDSSSFSNSQAETISNIQNDKTKFKYTVGRKAQKSFGRIEGLKALSGLRNRTSKGSRY